MCAHFAFLVLGAAPVSAHFAARGPKYPEAWAVPRGPGSPRGEGGRGPRLTGPRQVSRGLAVLVVADPAPSTPPTPLLQTLSAVSPSHTVHVPPRPPIPLSFYKKQKREVEWVEWGVCPGGARLLAPGVTGGVSRETNAVKQPRSGTSLARVLVTNNAAPPLAPGVGGMSAWSGIPSPGVGLSRASRSPLPLARLVPACQAPHDGAPFLAISLPFAGPSSYPSPSGP